MNCYYCDLIRRTDAAYPARPATRDLASASPRCDMHWRFDCARCNRPAHFMATAWCPDTAAYFCRACAPKSDEILEPVWGWESTLRYASPWTGQMLPALDRLEYDGRHPLQRGGTAGVSGERELTRYPQRPSAWRLDTPPDDNAIRESWNTNADRWDAGYDDDGDRNRRYQSDEPMLAMLGNVAGKAVLDVGCGGGYLCRKLARAGATMTGVDLSDRFIALARARESKEPLGITYHNHTVASMPFVPTASIDKAVSNYVLMDLGDYQSVIAEVARVLRPGGTFVAVISHPCFSSGEGWQTEPPDSPRPTDRRGMLVDRYFHRESTACVWGNFDPVIGFHRPLRDYFAAFAEAGFNIAGFDEPSITDRGRREMPLRVAQSLRVAYSCIFGLVKR